ncbi:MAG: hypothetical protein M1820_003033 [Bogoriella megaspora]|nr:MAG: hypothetical protein M1820_003033 [Bogoriella megaspora]
MAAHPPRTPGAQPHNTSRPSSRTLANPPTITNITGTTNSHAPRLSTAPSQKPRQLSHLHAQLAQLTAHMSDLENLLRMTAVQAESMRGLGGYAGGMFMAASRVLGEETVTGVGLSENNKEFGWKGANYSSDEDGEGEKGRGP